MRRLPRILLNAATAGSLVLAASSVALWVRSNRSWDEYFRCTEFVWNGGEAAKESDEYSAWVGWTGGDLYVGRARMRSQFWDGGPVGTHERGGWTTGQPESRSQVDLYGEVLANRPPGSGPPPPRWAGIGISYTAAERDVGRLAEVHLAFVTLFVLALLLPASRIGHGVWNRVTRRLRIGLCPSCGYDLRATPDRCPECGTAPKERLISN